MKKNTLVSQILQVECLKKFVAEAISEYNEQRLLDSERIYHDTGRKMTVLVLVQYLLLVAMVNCRSFREAELLGVEYGLAKVDFTTLAKKAQDVPYEIIQRAFCKIVATRSREIWRKTEKSFWGMLQILDSTRITAYKTKWRWAPFLRESSGLKFHVLYYPELDCAVKIETSKIGEGDTAHMLSFQNPDRILIADRGYMNLKNLAELAQVRQKFVVRMRNTVKTTPVSASPMPKENGYTDEICMLGKKNSRHTYAISQAFRIVRFRGNDNSEVILCTNIIDLPASEIAQMYKERWQIECFFRRLKQNFQIKRLFGQSQNAAFSQGLCAFIAYLFMEKIYTVLVQKKKFTGTLCNFLHQVKLNLSLPIRCLLHKMDAVLIA